MISRHRWLLLAVLLLAIGLTVWIGPAERTLGNNVRVVYLHGAWVWTALIALAAAAVAGAVGLLRGAIRWLHFSRSFGQTGTIFWITYLPLSLWAMQANWNGLFLLEPRWRLGINFAVAGLLLQAAILLIQSPPATGLINLAYASALFLALSQTEQVMHPPSPIANAGSSRIQLYFLLLVLLCLLTAWFMSRLLNTLQAKG